MGASLAGHRSREPHHIVGVRPTVPSPSGLPTEQERVLDRQRAAGNRAAAGPLRGGDLAPTMAASDRPSGESLDAGTRRLMESRLGQDFSGVRVHTDQTAAQAARQANATAFTVGPDVVLGVGAPSPRTRDGQRLLAHELAHVVQQHPGAGVAAPGSGSGPEREADAAASAVTRGEGFAVQARTGVTVARSGPGSPPSPLTLPAEGVDMPWVGRLASRSSELGYLRDQNYFWTRFQQNYGDRISRANAARIASGQAPVVDARWVRHYPQHGAYLGQTLEHHHVGQGSRAVPLPERLHDAQTVFHPQRKVVGTPTGGTATGGSPKLPPQPTPQRTAAEIRRHVRAGRIRGQGITPGSPPPTPAVPVSSEVAAVQGTPGIAQAPVVSAPPTSQVPAGPTTKPAVPVSSQAASSVAKVESAVASATATEVKTATRLSRVGSGLGKLGTFGMGMLLPGPLDALGLLANTFGAYGEAREAIRSRNTRTGFAIGLSGFLLGRSLGAVGEHFARKFVQRDLFGSATGVAEKSHNAGLSAGFHYGEQLSDEAKDALREVGFAALAAQGRLPERQQDLFTAEGVNRLAGALLPSVDQIFEAMQAQAEKEEEAERRRQKQESGTVGMKV